MNIVRVKSYLTHNTHRSQVTALIITTYLSIRFHHAVMTKENKGQGINNEKKDIKLILFRKE